MQDPTDGLCLSPRGFAACDTTTLWTVGMVKGRQSIVSFLYPSEEAFCLERVPIGKYDSRVRIASCKAKGSLAWNIKTKPTGAMVMADTTQCIARQNNFAAMQPCDFGYTALSVVDAGVHDRGFLLATKDGTCFDGVRFRLCDPKDARLYWGAAVRFDNPRGDVRARARGACEPCARASAECALRGFGRGCARSVARAARRGTIRCSNSTRSAGSPAKSAW